jgi:hypothetical protein
MLTSLALNSALLQEAIDLDSTIPIETLIETALREYIDHRKRLKIDASQSFGESIVDFRAKHNISQLDIDLDIDPDEIWGDVRDRTFAGQAVSFE